MSKRSRPSRVPTESEGDELSIDVRKASHGV